MTQKSRGLREGLYTAAVIISALPVGLIVIGRAFTELPKIVIEIGGWAIVGTLLLALILLILSCILPDRRGKNE
jgi:hypothetical protein